MQPCPRQVHEATLQTQLRHQSHWLPDGTCSYCGSLSPEWFFSSIDLRAELGPTDKNYKVYVTRPDPEVGKPTIYSMINYQPDYGRGWVEVTADNLRTLPTERLEPRLGHWVKIEPRSAFKTDKFYFQHLSDDEQLRFVQLLNEKKLNIGHPGYFYRLPFFVVPL